MAFSQFRDLPQIDFDENGPLSNRLPYHFAEEATLRDQKSDDWSLRSLDAYAGTTLQLDAPNVKAVSSMQRFLEADEHDPFTPEMLRAEAHGQYEGPRMYHRLDFSQSYESRFPDYYGRHCSPEGTTCSSSSGGLSVSRSDEPHSSAFIPQYSFGAQSDSIQNALPYSMPPHLYAYSPELSRHGGSCALSDIQNYPDESLEQAMDGYEQNDTKLEHDHYDGDNIHVRPLAQHHGEVYTHNHEDEGIGESIRDAESVQPCSHEDDASDSDYKPSSPTSVTAKRRRRYSSAFVRSSKGPGRTRKSSSSGSGSPTTSSPASKISGRKKKMPKHTACPTTTTPRPFRCPLAAYSCTSTFTSKNEWKRHVSTQHVKLGFWRCDQCPPSPSAGAAANPSFNDFNRKDLFTQHLRRMHGPRRPGAALSDAQVAQHQERCYKRLRDPPSRSGCIFCESVFDGDGSWEDRMEHVGTHFERERKGVERARGSDGWREDAVLREWLLAQGLVEEDGKGGWRIA